MENCFCRCEVGECKNITQNDTVNYCDEHSFLYGKLPFCEREGCYRKVNIIEKTDFMKKEKKYEIDSFCSKRCEEIDKIIQTSQKN